jgi:hypothetical protein
LYKIVIKEKDNSIIEFQTTQMNRKSIKEFYSTIVKRIPKKENWDNASPKRAKEITKTQK